MMSNFKTFGYIVVLGVFVSITCLAGNNNGNRNGVEFNLGKCMENPRAHGENSAQDCVNVAKEINPSSDDQAKQDEKACRKAARDFSDNLQKFESACQSPFEMSGSATECRRELNKCKRGGRSKNSKACLANGADVKKFESEAHKLKMNIDKAQVGLSKFQEQKAKITQQIQKSVADAQSKVDDADQKYREEMAKNQDAYENNLTQSQRQAAATVQKLKADYDKMDADIHNYIIQKEQAKLTDYTQQMAKQDDACEQKALSEVNAEVKLDITDAQKGIRRVGGGAFASMAAFSGQDDHQRYQERAQLLYLRCIDDPSYVRHSDIFNEQFLVQARTINGQVQAVRAAMTQNIAQQNLTIQNAALDQNRIFVQAQRQEQTLQQSVMNMRQKMQNQLMTEENAAKAQLDAIQQRQAAKQNSINDDQAYLDQRLKLLKGKEAAADGRDYSKDDVNKLWDAKAKAESAANQVLDTCTTKQQPTICDTASAFVNSGNSCTQPSVPDPKLTAAAQTGGVDSPSGDGGGQRAPTSQSFHDHSNLNAPLIDTSYDGNGIAPSSDTHVSY